MAGLDPDQPWTYGAKVDLALSECLKRMRLREKCSFGWGLGVRMRQAF